MSPRAGEGRQPFSRSDLPVLCQGLERLAHNLRLVGDHLQIGPRGLVGLGTALLPIAQRADRNAEDIGELFLGQPERPAYDLWVGPLHPLELRVAQGLPSGSLRAALRISELVNASNSVQSCAFAAFRTAAR